MAADKLVDSAQLDAALTATASAIRAKTGGTVSLPWNLSTGFQSAIEEIPSGGFPDTGDTLVYTTRSTIENGAFMSNYSLTAVNFPAVTSIGSNAFSSCHRLTTANFPVATSIGASAFYNCTALSEISLPATTRIDSFAFHGCSALPTANFPAVTAIGGNAFASCTALSEISFPSVSTIASSAFYNCTQLTTASFPAATAMYGGAFYGGPFDNCTNLISLYLLGSSMCQLYHSNTFTSTPIGGYSAVAGQYGSIYVPASLLSAYQSATNWAYFSSRFVGLTDEEIAALEG